MEQLFYLRFLRWRLCRAAWSLPNVLSTKSLYFIRCPSRIWNSCCGCVTGWLHDFSHEMHANGSLFLPVNFLSTLRTSQFILWPWHCNSGKCKTAHVGTLGGWARTVRFESRRASPRRRVSVCGADTQQQWCRRRSNRGHKISMPRRRGARPLLYRSYGVDPHRKILYKRKKGHVAHRASPRPRMPRAHCPAPCRRAHACTTRSHARCTHASLASDAHMHSHSNMRSHVKSNMCFLVSLATG